jgi:hypothetical protein
LLPKHGHDAAKVHILSVVLTRGVVDVLVEGALELLVAMLDVVHSDVDVAYSLAELMIASCRE